METNTVVLSLAAYNELREFKEKMESSGNVYRLAQPRHRYYSCNHQVYSPVTYITTDEALIEILEQNKAIADENNQLKYHRTDNSDFKKMSIWEFIKWRKIVKNK